MSYQDYMRLFAIKIMEQYQHIVYRDSIDIMRLVAFTLLRDKIEFSCSAYEWNFSHPQLPNLNWTRAANVHQEKFLIVKLLTNDQMPTRGIFASKRENEKKKQRTSAI